MKDNFKFWVPLDIKKATDKHGNEIMKIGGIASTSAKDSDGEFLDPNGFNLQYFKDQGFLNWHHQAKNNPEALIGEPTKAEIRKEGLYIEGILYPDNKIAQSVWETAKTLEKNSSTRRLGFSIEGKATKRKSMDENHPDYKIIQKADITGCAVTAMPKNPKTFLDIIKGHTDDSEEEYDDETLEMIKALEAGSVTGQDTTNVSTAGSGAPLKSESGVKIKKINTLEEDEEDEKTNKNKKLTKAEVYEQIFSKQPDISLLDAEKVFHYIKKINMAKDLDKVGAGDVEKALQLLDKAQDLIKGNESGIEVPKFSKDDETDSIKKANDYFVLATKDAEFSKSEVMSTLIEKGGYPTDVVKKALGKKDKEEKEEDSDEDKVNKFKKKKAEVEEMEKALIEKGLMTVTPKEDKKPKGKKKDDEDDDDKDDMKKGLEDVGTLIKQKNESVGVILKAVYDEMLSVKEIVSSIKEENIDLKKALDESNETITGLKTELGDLTKALDEPPIGGGRKSTMVTGRERNFGGDGKQDLTKGGDNDGKTIRINERNKVLNVLDEATFAKGMDTEFCEAMTTFESQGTLTGHILNRLKNERGISITK